MLTGAYYAAGAAWAGLTARSPIGTSIYEQAGEWDICVVLDSLRLDTARDLAPDALQPIAGRWSVGSITTEWTAQTFRDAHAAAIADTTLLTANPHTATVLDDRAWLTDPDAAPVSYPALPTVERDAFAAVHDLYRTHADEHHAVPPETMCDATIQAWREGADRVVAHWLQPHEPFIAADAPLVGGRATETSIWAAVQAGEADASAVRASYRANCRRALDALTTLLNAVDADVLVTADHGNLFGELGQWGHPFGMLHPAVRTVPWRVVSATRTREVTPAIDLDATADADTTAQLAALGYR